VIHPTIVRNVLRADPAHIRRLGECGVATVHEAMGRVGLLDAGIRPIFPDARVAGSAVTVICGPGDNLMIHAAVSVVRPGDVLVVTTFSPSNAGMFGELLGESSRAHGVAGLVIDAAVRDTAELTAMGFPVWSRAIWAQGTTKAIAGSVNVPIVCAGAGVHPGDVIVGDADGVVVIPRAEAPAAVAAAEERVAKEARTRERLRAGELGLDIYGLREILAKEDVSWED
jgi:4-hydroxy-4-methyl-2-oxoglutarate aldolase